MKYLGPESQEIWQNCDLNLINLTTSPVGSNVITFPLEVQKVLVSSNIQ